MDAQTGEVAGASVQIGDPITEKGLIDVIVRARDLGLYTAITDCGAGGLSSAAGEMASTIGMVIIADKTEAAEIQSLIPEQTFIIGNLVKGEKKVRLIP
jgi:phosphoribosylformylglycinamidine (FGAM) synthase-like enzyme